MPKASKTAMQTNRSARAQVHANHSWERMCLKFVRTMWGLPGGTATAQDAWHNARHKHSWSGDVEDIPFGAAVFSMRAGGGRSDAGHVFLCGGHDKSGRRMFFTNDVEEPGMISRVPITAISEGWNHTIWGWTSDLNGYDLPLGLSPNARRKKKKNKAKNVR